MTFDFETTLGERDHVLRVTGAIMPIIPARGLSGPPEYAYPAEGGEIEDVQLFLIHKRKDGRLVERELQDPTGALFSRLEVRIADHCAEMEDAAEEVAAESRREAREDG